MILKRYILVIFTAAMLLTVIGCADSESEEDIPVYLYEDIDRVYVAHAGGVCDGYAGTNSLEAITESVKQGYKLIEVDFTRTTDKFYVLNHDWEYMSNRIAFAKNEAVDSNTFLSYNIYNKFTPMSLEDLIAFLDEHEEIHVITDIKDENYSVLHYIKKHYKKYVDRFIPQVYAFKDYKSVKRIGFKNVIITVYSMPYDITSDPEYIYKQAKKLKPYAVAIPQELLSDEYISKLHPDEIRYFAHTVNDSDKAEELFNSGIYGIYTDSLLAYDYREGYDVKTANINERISTLTAEQRAVLNNCLIYEYNSEICIADGTAGLIYADTLLTPIKNKENIYLPIAKTLSYLGSTEYLYISEEQAVTFEYNEKVYKIGKEGIQTDFYENAVVYCNAYYCPDRFFVNIFDCIVTEKDGHIIVLKGTSGDTERLNRIDELNEVLNIIYG